MAGLPGTGTLLKMSDMGGTPVFTTIANISNIKPPGGTTDMSDTTTHDSPNGDEEKTPTQKRTTDMTFTLNWNPNDPTHDGITGIAKVWADKQLTDFKIVFPPAIGLEWPVSGYVSRLEPNDIPVNGIMQIQGTISVVAPLNFP